jgi:hypothetical protein
MRPKQRRSPKTSKLHWLASRGLSSGCSADLPSRFCRSAELLLRICQAQVRLPRECRRSLRGTCGRMCRPRLRIRGLSLCWVPGRWVRARSWRRLPRASHQAVGRSGPASRSLSADGVGEHSDRAHDRGCADWACGVSAAVAVLSGRAPGSAGRSDRGVVRR